MKPGRPSFRIRPVSIAAITGAAPATTAAARATTANTAVIWLLASVLAGCLPDPAPPGPESGAGDAASEPAKTGGGTGGTAGVPGFSDLQVTHPSDPPAPLAQSSAEEPSAGGTLTFQQIGAPGWYPSRRDPASGQCDAWNQNGCCLARHEATGVLAPWDEELILTLRGPMLVKTLAAYRPEAGDRGRWRRVSLWEQGAAMAAAQGIAFLGDGAASFQGKVGNKCLVDVSTDKVFPCGPGSVPFCPANTASPRYGWEGSKLLLIQASMPHFGDPALAGVSHCSTDPTDNWYDAPWVGLSHGELIRSGKFGNCHCYSRDPSKWWLADGCGQFNVFEVVNDNNDFRNLRLFSTNFFAYHGYVGEGPCGKSCDVASLPATVDLVDKSTSRAAAQGALASPSKGPGAAFRRPAAGYRWFMVLMDGTSRTIQLAVFHPDKVPAMARSLAPSPPADLLGADIEALLALRLPAEPPLSIRRP